MINSNSPQPVERSNAKTTLASRSFKILLCLAVLPASVSSQAQAAEVYNNFGSELVNFWWGAGPAGLPDEDVGPVKTAQQFLLDGNDTVTNVSMQMIRWGTPRGRVDVEIWEDDGAGQPGRMVGTLGSVDDISTFPVEFIQQEGETPEERAGITRDLVSLSFDTVVSGLNPDLPHYVLIDYEEASGNFGSSFSWTVVGDSEGTNGAQGAMLTTEFPLFNTPDFLGEDTPYDGSEFFTIGEMACCPTHQHFKMSVSAVPEPDAAFISLFGLFGLLGFRKRR